MVYLGLDFLHSKVFTKALKCTRPLSPRMKTIIDIWKQCDRMYLGMVYKAEFLLSFFSLHRISNLVLHLIRMFDLLKQSRGHGGNTLTSHGGNTLTSEARVRFLAWPQVGKLVVACCWSAFYSTEP